MGHSEDNHIQIQKPVTFYAPLISGLLVILVILIIISVFNPKVHHNNNNEVPVQTEHANGHSEHGQTTHQSGDNH